MLRWEETPMQGIALRVLPRCSFRSKICTAPDSHRPREDVFRCSAPHESRVLIGATPPARFDYIAMPSPRAERRHRAGSGAVENARRTGDGRILGKRAAGAARRPAASLHLYVPASVCAHALDGVSG